MTKLYHSGWKFFTCTNCGKCCEEIGLPYDPLKVHEISKYLKITPKQLIEKYYGEITNDGKMWQSQDHKRTPCPFLITENELKKCSIYPVRPEGCQLYPLETDFGPGNVTCPAYNVVIKRLKNEQSQLHIIFFNYLSVFFKSMFVRK